MRRNDNQQPVQQNPFGVSSARPKRVGSEFLDTFLSFNKLDSKEREEVIHEIEDCFRRETLYLLHEDPKALEKKLTEADEAFSLFRKVLNLLDLPRKKRSSVDLMQEAHRMFEQKDYEEAFSLFQKAVVSSQPTVMDLCIAGTAALHCNKLEYAEEYAEQALLKSPTEVKALMLRGVVHFKRGMYLEALPYFEKAKTLEPGSNTAIKYFKQTFERVTDLKRQNRESIYVTNVDQPPVEQRVAELDRANNGGIAKRKWYRKAVYYDMAVSDYSSMAAYTVKVRSLSAGGCLVEGAELPTEFNFNLDLGAYGQVSGLGKKIYCTKTGRTGVRFIGLSHKEEDFVNQHLLSGR